MNTPTAAMSTVLPTSYCHFTGNVSSPWQSGTLRVPVFHKKALSFGTQVVEGEDLLQRSPTSFEDSATSPRQNEDVNFDSALSTVAECPFPPKPRVRRQCQILRLPCLLYRPQHTACPKNRLIVSPHLMEWTVSLLRPDFASLKV